MANRSPRPEEMNGQLADRLWKIFGDKAVRAVVVDDGKEVAIATVKVVAVANKVLAYGAATYLKSDNAAIEVHAQLHGAKSHAHRAHCRAVMLGRAADDGSFATILTPEERAARPKIYPNADADIPAAYRLVNQMGRTPEGYDLQQLSVGTGERLAALGEAQGVFVNSALQTALAFIMGQAPRP